jgi:mannose-6-phosphate isomerase-like protein (cupin superfamily)
MDIEKAKKELEEKYPGKTVVVNEDGDYCEVICEMKPASKGSKKSIAVAVVGKSKPHFHKKTTETYQVIKGALIVYLDGKAKRLKKGEKLEIRPGITHWAEGNEVWFKTYSTPAWTSEDHYLVKRK